MLLIFMKITKIKTKNNEIKKATNMVAFTRNMLKIFNYITLTLTALIPFFPCSRSNDTLSS